MITPLPHQVYAADKSYEILKRLGYVYIAGKPRVGKTLTAILVAEKSDKINNILILTKKSAIEGWVKYIDRKWKHRYYITNYEQVGRWNAKTNKAELKSDPSMYDLVIIDESHNLGKLGAATQRYKIIKALCWNLPHIHLSGTAIVESPNSIYYQMSISKFNPFKFKNFYDFHKTYGIKYYKNIGARQINMYDRCKETLLPEINKFTVYIDQEEAGIKEKAKDKLHYIDLDVNVRKLYNTLRQDRVLHLDEGELICDSLMKLRVSLHMLEGGVIKTDADKYVVLGVLDKIDYIFKTFGDREDTGIMSHFVAERELLKRKFHNAQIYSSNADAEGVDLSHLKNYIIYSSDYSGAKFIQRRERIMNLKGSNTTTVHHLLVRGAVSDQVYKMVSKKQDFNNSTYIDSDI